MAKKNQNVATETTSMEIEMIGVGETAIIAPAVVEKKVIPYVLADFMAEMKTKSAAVRRLAAEEFSKGDIARFMEIRYQHVRNILVTPLKKA